MQIQTIFLLTHAFHSHYKSFTVHRRSTREEGRRRLREKNRLERVRRGDVPCDMNHGIDSFLSQQPVALASQPADSRSKGGRAFLPHHHRFNPKDEVFKGPLCGEQCWKKWLNF